jgi:preprotein translocase subunit SecB
MGSLLQLEDFHLLKLQIDVNEKFNPENKVSIEYESHFSFDVLKAEDRLLFKVPLDVTIKATRAIKNCNIKKIRIKLEGYFSFEEHTPQTEINKYVPLNCLATLYGIARGIIANSTGSIPGPKFILPNVNLVELLRQKQEEGNN